MKKILLILTCLIANIALAQESTTTIYLIRHAEKASDGTSDPDISEAGKSRAAKWGKYFGDKGISVYYTTPYKRTTNTAAAISSWLATAPIPGTGKQFQMKVYAPTELLLRKLADENKGKNIVVVGHSNTIPAQINALLGEQKYADIPEDEYGNLYIIKITGARVTHELLKM